MRSALDVPTDSFNDYEKNLVSQIRKHGWFCTSVLSDENHLGFSYSTGLWLSLNHPELIVFSIDGTPAHDIYRDFYDAIRNGGRFPVGQRLSGIFKGFDAILAPVSRERYGEYILSSRWFYGGEDFPCLQLIWPDPVGLFPWESGADSAFANSQPDLSPTGWNSLSS
jgi:hypothetical protein